MTESVIRGHAAANEKAETAAAFAAVKEGYLRLAVGSLDDDEILKWVRKARALDDVQSELQRVIDAGKLDEKFPAR